MAELSDPVVSRRNICGAVVGVVMMTVALCGCGGGSDSASPGGGGASAAASTSASTSAAAEPSASTTTPTASASTSGTVDATFVRKQVVRLHDVAYQAANDERAKQDQYFATDPGRVDALLDTVAAQVPAVLTQHPAGGSVHLAYLVAAYDSSQLTCTPSDHTLEVLLVAGKDGVAFTTIINTHTESSFRIFDAARAGKEPFDKDGFNVGAGGCRKKGSVEAMASRDITLP